MLVKSALLTTTAIFGNTEKKQAYKYFLAQVTATKTALPEGKYIPFDWAFSEIGVNTEGVVDFGLGISDVGSTPPKSEISNPKSNEGVFMSWNNINIPKKSAVRLRITSATDVREICILQAKTAISGKKVGILDMRFAHYMQPFELEISAEMIKTVIAEGITLTLKEGTKPLWIFSNGDKGQTATDAFLPHLLVYDSNIQQDAWKNRLLSRASVQPFGWMQGVVWDGLLEMSPHFPKAKTVLNQELDLYFGQNQLIYANYNNVKSVDSITTVESILPFAILAQINPTHRLDRKSVV